MDEDLARLADLVSIWWRAANDVTALLSDLAEEDWDKPTDLPGWDVRAVASHIAHLESAVAGGPQEVAEIGDLPHVRNPMAQFTEIGVANRRDRSGVEITAEIRAAVTRRYEALHAEPPTDPDAPAPGVFGALGWTVERLLRNRPLDLWMHEQDIRRAVGRPGNLDSPAAEHTTEYLLESIGYVLAKRVGAPTGTTLVVEVDGSEPASAVVADDGRGVLLGESPTTPTARLRTDRETFIRLAGGRGAVDPDAVVVEGDRQLATSVVGALAVTP